MSALFNVMDETMADTPNLLKYTQENVRVIYEQPSLSPVVIKSIFIGVCMSEIGQ